MVNREAERKRLVKLIDNFLKEELGANLNKDILDKFADHLLDDGWTRPPVKVGQTVYLISEVSRKIAEAKAIGVWLYDDICNVITNQGVLHQNAIGETVFLTREDALKALEGKEDEGK